MLSSKLQDAFNKQINAELFSSYLYLSMAAYFEAGDLKGLAHWMQVQADEERAHAMRIYHFINDRSGRVTLAAIEAPKAEWKSPLEAFEDAYKHEQKITGMIGDLMNLVAVEKDGAGHDFLEWFCREQVEEESQVQLIVAQLKLVAGNGVGLYMIDQELGKRGGK
jgi:ferritin